MCKEEEEAIKVDVHEGCGRVKLFWILALSDARNLKSLLEFRHGGTTSTTSCVFVTGSSSDGGHFPSLLGGGANSSCRYCGSVISPSSVSIFDNEVINVCSEPDCQVFFYLLLEFKFIS